MVPVHRSELLQSILEGLSSRQEAIVLCSGLFITVVPLVGETVGPGLAASGALGLHEHLPSLILVFFLRKRSALAMTFRSTVRGLSPAGIVSRACPVSLELVQLVLVCVAAILFVEYLSWEWLL